MKKMKKLFSIILISFITSTAFTQEKAITWHTDMNEAINKSLQTEKPLLLFFTGSDWCGWCIKLQKAVFKKPEFKKWAKENVVLVELDFPKRTKLDPNIQKQNRELQRIFGVRGYPTVWYVQPKVIDGKVNLNKRLGSQGASPLEVKSWIAGAKNILKNK
tara:strand:- start:438 stop:917 length:480 start_codon:yes stop_codon:yes gene_type:complete